MLELPDEPLLFLEELPDELPPDDFLAELPDEPLLFLEELPDELPPDDLLLEELLEELRLELPEEPEELFLVFDFDSAIGGHLGLSGSWVK